MRILFLLFALMLSGLLPSRAQDTPDTGGEARATADVKDGVRQAMVVIDGETLFPVHGVTAFPANRRAQDIAARIRSLAANPKIHAGSLTLEEHARATWIVADGQRVMTVLDEDAALEETSRDIVAAVFQKRIWEAIEAYRQARQPELLRLHALYAVVATLLLFLVAYVVRRIVLLLRSLVERRYRDRLDVLASRSLQIVKAEQVWRVVSGVLSVSWGLAILVIFYVWLQYVLGLFPWSRSFSKKLFDIAVDPLRTTGMQVLESLPNLAFLAVLIFLTRYGLRIIRILFDGIETERVRLTGFDPEWSMPTYRLLRVFVIAFAAVVAYPYIPGSQSAAFKGVSLFMGVVFSLGSSSLIGNLIAGYSMTYRRAFRLGDRVKIGPHVGDVERMRLMVTHLRTPKNEEVIVPNSVIVGTEVVNYSTMAREQGLILHTTVGIGYETPWRQVRAMLLEAASRTPGLSRDPAPFVLAPGLGDFCVTYEINAYCNNPQAMNALYAELHWNILDVFNEYGVQIMTPAYEGDPEQPKLVPRDQWYAEPAQPPPPAQSGRDAGSAA